MSDWKKAKLSDVIDIISGGTPKRSTSEYWNGNIPWLSVADFNNGFRFVSKSSEYITKLGLEKSSTKLLSISQLIISARGTVGCLAQLSIPMAFNQSCYGLNGKEGIINNDFLYYFLKNNINELKSKTHGSIFDTITKETFDNIDITYPTLETQKKISDILGFFDQKIELNTQINQTLEQIAQAIFKSWFIDFDPIHAKAQSLAQGENIEQANLAAMSVISGKSPQELAEWEKENPETYQELYQLAEAFPCEIGENRVPVGWEMSLIGNEIETLGGSTPSTKNNEFWNNGNIFWTTPKDLSSLKEKILLKTERKITEKGLGKISSGLLPINTVLMSSRAPVGYLSLTKIPVAINQGYIAMKCNKILSCYYILQWCDYHIDEIKSRAGGTTFQEINKSTFRNIAVLTPSKKIINEYDKLLTRVYDLIENNIKENTSLSKLRGELLPKLLNGEIEL